MRTWRLKLSEGIGRTSSAIGRAEDWDNHLLSMNHYQSDSQIADLYCAGCLEGLFLHHCHIVQHWNSPHSIADLCSGRVCQPDGHPALSPGWIPQHFLQWPWGYWKPSWVSASRSISNRVPPHIIQCLLHTWSPALLFLWDVIRTS